MLSVTCPSCGEIGRIPVHLMGIPIKCKKCRGGLLVSSSVARAAMAEAELTPAAALASSHAVAVEALEPDAWRASGDAMDHAPAEQIADPDPEHGDDETTASFLSPPGASRGPFKEYKLLSFPSPEGRGFPVKPEGFPVLWPA